MRGSISRFPASGRRVRSASHAPYFLDKGVSAGVDIFYRRLTPDANDEDQVGFGLRMGYDISEYLPEHAVPTSSARIAFTTSMTTPRR